MRLVRARVAPDHPAGGGARLSIGAHTHITNSYLNSFTITHMGIGQYIKDIGRGKDGARALDRARATDLMGQILDQQVSDLELGAFCIAMRIKGETPEEMAGFLDATHARLNKVHSGHMPTVVLPSYNGARKLPVLTPLLALLLAREGVAVVVHGAATEDKRVSTGSLRAPL